jgi:plastocyanin
MKKIYALILMFTLLLYSGKIFAVTHVVTLNDNPFSFSPANMTIDVGDTIIFSLLSGSHTTTSTSVPVGAATWNVPINNSNPTFQYVVNVSGQYNYQCNPHASMGMVGQFTALGTSGVNAPALTSNFSFNFLEQSAYRLNYTLNRNADVRVTLFDITGKTTKVLLATYKNAGKYAENYVIDDIRTGIYMVEMVAGNERIVRRIIIN